MTKDEFIAQRFATKLKVAKQAQLILQIEQRHEAQLATLLEAPKEVQNRLEADDQQEHDSLLPLLEGIPFKRHDFVRYGADEYYEVQEVRVELASLYNRYSDVSPDQLTGPPKDFMRVKLACFKVRKSGILARWPTSLDPNNGNLCKVELSEHLCLRRALKQRMRRRLEGGD